MGNSVRQTVYHSVYGRRREKFGQAKARVIIQDKGEGVSRTRLARYRTRNSGERHRVLALSVVTVAFAFTTSCQNLLFHGLLLVLRVEHSASTASSRSPIPFERLEFTVTIESQKVGSVSRNLS